MLIVLSVYKSIGQVQEIKLDEKIKTDGICVVGESLYIAEGWDGSKILKITGSKIEVFATGLHGPIDVIRAQDGNFYVSEWSGASLSKISPDGNVSKFIRVKPGPGPMSQDSNGNIYVSHNVNDGSGFITKIALDGSTSIYSSDSLLINPGGIDFDSLGNLYVANFNNGQVIKITPKGNASVFSTIPGNQAWRTGHLKIINNHLFVSGLMSNHIYKVDFDGKVTLFLDIKSLSSYDVYFPNGLAHDKSNDSLYATKAFNETDTILKIRVK